PVASASARPAFFIALNIVYFPHFRIAIRNAASQNLWHEDDSQTTGSQAGAAATYIFYSGNNIRRFCHIWDNIQTIKYWFARPSRP
ncbi:hypothetical protein, partial [Thalassospira sp.]|uniref:hypothetical protein n=1 Tax=Thalassospira sp. TaxID=1912094 RepID=UPI00311D4123